MKIQLIHSPLYVNIHAMTSNRPSLPLGLASVCAVLRKAGHQVSVIDAVGLGPTQYTVDRHLHYVGLSPEEIAERIDPSVDVIGISNMWTFSWPLVRRIIHEIKRKHPVKILIGGGEHFTGLPKLSLETTPIDYLVLGEGEETSCELLAALERNQKDLSNVPGIAFRRNGDVIITEKRKRIKDVDSLPWPAWDLFNPKFYYEKGFIAGLDSGMTMPILATRGCPYGCTYCSSSNMWNRRWYARTPKNVVDEMEFYQKKYGAINFPFQDLTAILQKKWVIEFCQEILTRGMKITWQLHVGTRGEVIDDEVAEFYQKTGGHNLCLAPESGSERTRKLIKKKMSEESLMKAVRASTKQGLTVCVFLVLGFPHDKWSDIRKTIRLARKLALAGVNDLGLGFFFPIPGTELCNQLIADGRIDFSDDRFFFIPFAGTEGKLKEENNFCNNLTAKQLTRAKYLILLNFYPLSFAIRPVRPLRILVNLFRGRETTKLEGYLNNLKSRLKIWISGKVK